MNPPSDKRFIGDLIDIRLMNVKLRPYQKDIILEYRNMMDFDEGDVGRGFYMVCMRRTGKTTAIAMIIATHLRTQNEQTIRVHATCERASDGLGLMVHEMMFDLKCKTKSTESDDGKCIKSIDSNSMVIFSHGTNGIDEGKADLVIFDECNFMREKDDMEKLVRSQLLSGSKVICVTTPATDVDVFSNRLADIPGMVECHGSMRF
jgi:phage terminase large subunit-like protein